MRDRAVRGGAGHGAWRVERGAVAALAVVAAAARADVPGPPIVGEELATGRLRAFSVQVDNDSLATWPHDDRWYTSGFGLRWVHEAGGDGAIGRLAQAWCARAGCGDGVRAYRLTTIAHRIYNPVDTATTAPQPRDRPYAGWLSIGVGLLLREPDEQVRLDLHAGVIGPAALGEPVQNGVHRALGLDVASGWDTQLRPRAVLQLGWARLGRHGGAGGPLDAVHRFALDAGTLRAIASAGAMLRWGAPPADPTWPGEPRAAWAPAAGAAGRWHLYVGADARAVAHDRLVDGRAYGYAPEVRPEPFGGDVFAGASMRLGREWLIDLTMTLRSVEFDATGPGAPEYRTQRFGTLQLRWAAP